MVFACVLFVLFTAVLVVPCVIDIATSPPWALRTLTTRKWLLIVGAFSVAGCAAWLIAGRPRRTRTARRIRPARRRAATGPGMSAAEAFMRHPAGRSMGPDAESAPGASVDFWSAPPVGPDDDDEFLLELGRRIRESREDY